MFFFYKCHDWVMYGGCAHTVQRSDKKEGELKWKKESFELHTPGFCNEWGRSVSVSYTWTVKQAAWQKHTREFLCLTQSQFSMAQQNKQDITDEAKRFFCMIFFFWKKLIL